MAQSRLAPLPMMLKRRCMTASQVEGRFRARCLRPVRPDPGRTTLADLGKLGAPSLGINVVRGRSGHISSRAGKGDDLFRSLERAAGDRHFMRIILRTEEPPSTLS